MPRATDRDQEATTPAFAPPSQMETLTKISTAVFVSDTLNRFYLVLAASSTLR